MSEIIERLRKLDREEMRTNDPQKLQAIANEREYLYEQAYSGVYGEE